MEIHDFKARFSPIFCSKSKYDYRDEYPDNDPMLKSSLVVQY
ncbi:MAG: hypothetical protein QXE40_05175 [Nitrososphaerota archaeon]